MTALQEFFEHMRRQRELDIKYQEGYKKGWTDGRESGWHAATEAMKAQVIGMELESPKFPE